MKQLLSIASTLPLALGRYRRELIWIAAGLALILPLGYGAKLRVDAANELRQGIVLSGSGTVTVDRVQVMAEVTGVVREIPQKGARVTAGQPLARVENLDLEAAVVLARSQLDVARAGLARSQAPARSDDLEDLDAAIKLATVALDAAQKAVDSLHAGINAAARPRQDAQNALNQELKALQAKASQNASPHHAAAPANGQSTVAQSAPMGGHGSAQTSGGGEEADCEVHQQLNELTRTFQTVTVPVAAADQAVSAARDTSLMEQLMAQVEVARINLDLAKARKARATAPPRSEEASEAHARVQQAQIALTLAEQKLQKASLTAPVSGLVLDVPVAKGTPVNIGQPLVTLSNEAVSHVTLRARSKTAGSVEVDQRATVTIGDTTVSGRVTAVTSEPDGAYTSIKVTLEPAGNKLADGAVANVKILADSPAD